VTCCDTIEAPVVDEDPYEVEAEKMTNTIWESVSKMEDKELRRDNAERTSTKLTILKMLKTIEKLKKQKKI